MAKARSASTAARAKGQRPPGKGASRKTTSPQRGKATSTAVSRKASGAGAHGRATTSRKSTRPDDAPSRRPAAKRAEKGKARAKSGRVARGAVAPITARAAVEHTREIGVGLPATAQPEPMRAPELDQLGLPATRSSAAGGASGEPQSHAVPSVDGGTTPGLVGATENARLGTDVEGTAS